MLVVYRVSYPTGEVNNRVPEGTVMVEHRFRELLSSRVSFATVSDSDAFVPCPVASFGVAQQQLQIAEVYRIAAERTREQLQPKRSFRLPKFSRN